ncbi:MAG: GNAT family N-acetyltransferase [Anaerolineae bacterium]|jgi:ribosomal-protein-alanine N-acetyltransferase
MGMLELSPRMTARIARPADEIAIRGLLSSVARTTVRIGWWAEYLGQDIFLLTLVGGRPTGALLSYPDVGPVAWVMLGAVSDGVEVGVWLDCCLPLMRSALRRRGARVLAWMDAGEWAGPALQTRGFRQTGRIVNLLKEDRDLPVISVPDVYLREVRTEDIESVARVDRGAFTPPWWLSKLTLDRARRMSTSFLVAERAGRCVGYVTGRAAEGHAHIDRLAVGPSFQGEGIGALLLVGVLNQLWEQGVEEVTLNTQESNRSSQRLYRRFGFRPLKEKIIIWERGL